MLAKIPSTESSALVFKLSGMDGDLWKLREVSTRVRLYAHHCGLRCAVGYSLTHMAAPYPSFWR
jgi:hypothetical protein